MYQFFLPESMYTIDSEMYFDKIHWYYETGSTITGKVIRIHEKQKFFDVDLGTGFLAKMPFNESTIYPIYKYKCQNLSPELYSLIGKMIQVKITKFKDLYTIEVSRKQNMEELIINIKDQKYFEYVEITGYSKLSAFIDVGGGIRGKISASNFSPIRFNNIRDVEIPVGTIIPASVLNFNTDTMQFELSRIPKKVESTLYQNQIVTAKVFDPLRNGTGYFCLVKNSIGGILDSPNFKLHYGDNVVASIKSITPKGLRIEFLKKFNF